jgi:preprotein translocase subunit SecD
MVSVLFALTACSSGSHPRATGSASPSATAGTVHADTAMRYVIYKPVTAIPSAAVDDTVQTLRKRLVGLGVAKPDIRRGAHHESILVGVPAAQQGTLNGLSAIGRIEFREVYVAGPPGTSAPVAPSVKNAPGMDTYKALTCSSARPPMAPDSAPTAWLAACDANRTTRYLLEPAAIVGTDIAGVSPSQQVGNTEPWVVDVSFTSSGQKKFTRFTGATVGKQVAIVLDDVVQTAPIIDAVILGDAEISGNFTRSEAMALANVLRHGPLPTALLASTVTATIPPTFS